VHLINPYSFDWTDDNWQLLSSIIVAALLAASAIGHFSACIQLGPIRIQLKMARFANSPSLRKFHSSAFATNRVKKKSLVSRKAPLESRGPNIIKIWSRKWNTGNLIHLLTCSIIRGGIADFIAPR
jgi:hypothetical protein